VSAPWSVTPIFTIRFASHVSRSTSPAVAYPSSPSLAGLKILIRFSLLRLRSSRAAPAPDASLPLSLLTGLLQPEPPLLLLPPPPPPAGTSCSFSSSSLWRGESCYRWLWESCCWLGPPAASSPPESPREVLPSLAHLPSPLCPPGLACLSPPLRTLLPR
jgi:hypothetical protein